VDHVPRSKLVRLLQSVGHDLNAGPVGPALLRIHARSVDPAVPVGHALSRTGTTPVKQRATPAIRVLISKPPCLGHLTVSALGKPVA
jgi:hypothetical protein